MADASVILDRDVRALFEKGQENGTLRFQHSTSPHGVTKYYVFLWRPNPDDEWQDARMTKMELLGKFG